METINNTNAEQPYLPAYLKKRLATVNAQPTANEQPSENVTQNETETPKNEPTQSDNVTEPASPPPQPQSDDDQDGNEWKGRLRKEQENHKQTNAKLLAEVQARQRAEAELAELRSKQTASTPPTATPATPPPTATVEPVFSEKEMEDLRLYVGETMAAKLSRLLEQQGRMPEIERMEKVVDDKFAEHQARLLAQQKATQWQTAVSETIPEIHGLLQDSHFVEWANSKEIDYLGNSAMTLISQAGETQNVALLPKIKQLIEAFNQSKQPPAQPTTAPPSPGAVAKTPPAKPKMTAKDLAHKERLKRAGKTEELKVFLQKFDRT